MPVPPIRKNIAGQFFPIGLFTPAGAILKNHSPEVGDFVVYADWISQGNLTVTESPAGSGEYKAAPSQAQTNGDLLAIRCEDQTNPIAWTAYWLYIWTTMRSIDDLAFPNTSGLGMDIDISGGVEVGAMQASALAQFFTVNSGQTGAGAVAGSVVHEIGHAVLAIGTVFPAGAINYTYTLTDSVTLLPIQGADVWFSTDAPGVNIIWKGVTDVFGVARDVLGNLPALDPGVYFVWSQRAGYSASLFPDTETVP